MNAILQSIQQLAETGVPQTTGLILARFFPIITFTPLFGGHLTPLRFRLGLSLALAAALTPLFINQINQLPTPEQYTLLLAKESLIGLSLALFIRILFEMIASSGAIVDYLRESHIAHIFDPIARQQKSITAAFLLQFTIALFFTLGGAHVLLLAISQSYNTVRLFDPLPLQYINADASAFFINLLTDTFLIAVKLTVPIIIMLIILELALALLTRSAHQIETFFLGKTIKPSLAIFILLLALGYGYEAYLTESFDNLLKWINTPRPNP